MFQPAIFHEGHIEVMHQMMVEHPCTTVVSTATSGLPPDYISLVLHRGPTDESCFRGHIAAANPLWWDTEGSPKSWRSFKVPSHM